MSLMYFARLPCFYAGHGPGFSVPSASLYCRGAADVSISIDSNHSMMTTGEISKGQLDLAIGYQYKVTKGVIFETLFNEKVIMVTSMSGVDRWRLI